MGDRKDEAARVSKPLQLFGLGAAGGQRLVANHMDTGLEESLRGRGMHVVGRDDCHGLDPVRPVPLACRHGCEIGVDAVRRKADILTRRAAPLRIGGERPGHHLPAVVEPRDHPVRRADEGAAPATDHAEPKPAVQFSVL